jgi:hypothetical protein
MKHGFGGDELVLEGRKGGELSLRNCKVTSTVTSEPLRRNASYIAKVRIILLQKNKIKIKEYI